MAFAGGRLLIATRAGLIYGSSSQPGALWTTSWTSIASSGDGTRLLAAGSSGVFQSLDSGATWSQLSALSGITYVASSFYGSNLIAAGSLLYTSSNAGATWMPHAPFANWTSVAISDDGTRIVAAGDQGVYTYDAGPATNPPIIYSPPAGQPILVGSNAAFNVGAVGGALSYQWQFDNAILPGATNSSLALTNLVLTNAGTYAVLVSNAFGSSLSAGAQLTIVPPGINTDGSSDLTDSSVTLSGDVVPGSIGTTVWFQWGLDTNYGHATDPASFALGFDDSFFSSALAGLAPETVYHFRAVTSNSLAFVVGTDLSFTTLGLPFLQTGAPTNLYWSSLASSADGSHWVAVASSGDFTVSGGSIYTSTNSGVTWSLTSAPTNLNWTSVASSADGRILAATYGTISSTNDSAGNYFENCDGSVLVSTNAGLTWAPTSAPGARYWRAMASSSDGVRLAAAAGYYRQASGVNYLIYTSTNSGATWLQTTAPIGCWQAIASSTDGSKLIAVDDGLNNMSCTSTDGGATWMFSVNVWEFDSIASSADGTQLIGGGPGFGTSTDAGAGWTSVGVPWTGASGYVASSADGASLAAAGYNHSIYTSLDGGATWTPRLPAANWSAIASSADGSLLIAAVRGGGIYILRTTPTPSLSIAPSGNNALVSWLVP